MKNRPPPRFTAIGEGREAYQNVRHGRPHTIHGIHRAIFDFSIRENTYQDVNHIPIRPLQARQAQIFLPAAFTAVSGPEVSQDSSLWHQGQLWLVKKVAATAVQFM